MCINSMANAISALCGATYSRIAEHEAAWQVATAVAREAVAVARASGIDLDETETIRTGLAVCRSVGPATSSTEQDIRRQRPTEIDALNGYLARRGEALGIETPVNRVLWALVKLREQTPG
jgi:2-dehydropantoate 2-reductase